jgi:hypothetical protein
MKLIREHNEFNWIEDVSGHHENITNMDGLRFIIVGRNNMDWQVFRGWNHTYPVIGVKTHKGLLCYIVKLSETLDVYVPVEDVMDRERKNIDESTDEWDWIREIPISVSFEDAIIGRRYRIEPTEVLKDAIFECDDEEWMINSKVVDVMSKDIVSYGDVHCGNINQDKVLSLRLKFWGPNYETENNFWVTPNMLALYEMEGFINEEEENPLQWIIDEPIGITLQPNTLYYFKPHLTLDEIKVFANGINNSEYIKNFLLRTVLERVYNEKGKRPNGGLKYFVTGEDVNDRVVGWCTGTPVEQSVLFYANLNQVDTRKEFGI